MEQEKRDQLFSMMHDLGETDIKKIISRTFSYVEAKMTDGNFDPNYFFNIIQKVVDENEQIKKH